MSTETEKNINEAIDWLQQVGGSVQDFAVEQAPLYCREVVAWELWSNGLAAAGCFVAVIGLVVFLWKNREQIIDSWDQVELGWTIVGIVAAIMILPLTVGGCGAASKAVKAAVAPRLVIVEHLRGLKP